MLNTDIINAYLGSSQVDKIILGSEQVYPTAEPEDKLTLVDSDGGVYDGTQISPGVWNIQEAINNLANYTLYYGGEVVTADTHVTITNDWGGVTDYDADETGMVWSGVTYGYGSGDGTINVTINYSAQTGTAVLAVSYYQAPPDICEDWEGGGYSSYEECRCAMYGEYCEDPCADWEGAGYSSFEECRCINYGDYCDDPCAGYSSQEECECVMNGGTWNGTDCEFQMDDPGAEPDD